jgi:hypothetical protein
MEHQRIYHVYNRGINKERIFKEEENYHFFLKRYQHYVSLFVDTYAYCLMPTHFHFVVRIKENAGFAASGNTSEVLTDFLNFHSNKSHISPETILQMEEDIENFF